MPRLRKKSGNNKANDDHENEDDSSFVLSPSPVKKKAKTNQLRRRRRVAPPERLAWPGQVLSLSQTSAASTPPSHEKKDGDDSTPASSPPPSHENNHKRKKKAPPSTRIKPPPSSSPPLELNNSLKRQRDFFKNHKAVAFSSNNPPASTTTATATSATESSLLWIDKHRPTRSADLVVAPKKVKQVTSWLQEASGRGGLLLLVGGPGVGKSTLIQVLTQELGCWDTVEWTESFYQYQASLYGGHNAANMELQTPLQHWQQFMYQNAVGYASLEMEGGQITKPQQPASAHAKKRQRKLLAAAATSSLSAKKKKNKLIVLDELPYCHTPQAQATLKETLTNHILQSQAPTVWIWSHNVLEGKQHNPADLEALVEPTVLYNTNLVTFCPIHPATVARFQSTLKRVAQREHLNTLPPNWIAEMHAQSGGDIRFALYALQYQFGSSNGGISAVAPAADSSSSGTRDVRLSTFHALGKVFYAKRKKLKDDDAGEEAEAPLDFDPDAAMEHSGMDLSGSIHFLQHHSLDFFTDVQELSVTWDLYSDAAHWLDTTNNDSRHASAVAGRAVAYANRHPAPTKFRQFSKPQSFAVVQQRKANQWRLDQQARWYQQQQPLLRHSRPAFAMDLYPYGRRIAEKRREGQQLLANTNSGMWMGEKEDDDEEEDSASALSCFWNGPALQSFVHGQSQQPAANEEQHTQMKRQEQEQQDVLRQDDIADFDDD